MNCQLAGLLDCFTVLACWLQGCQRGMRHALWLAGFTLLWLAGLNIHWGRPHLQWILGNLQCIMGSCNMWKFPPFFKGHWQYHWHPVRVIEGDCELVYWLTSKEIWPYRAAIRSDAIVAGLSAVPAYRSYRKWLPLTSLGRLQDLNITLTSHRWLSARKT